MIICLFSTKAQCKDTSASLQALVCWKRISNALFIWRKVSQVFLQLLINHRRPFTWETANLARGGRVTLGVGSLGWWDRLTLGGEPTFSHVDGFKWVNSPSWAKSHHTEHVQADISVSWQGQLIITWLSFFPYRRAVRLAQGGGVPWGPGRTFLHINRA